MFDSFLVLVDESQYYQGHNDMAKATVTRSPRRKVASEDVEFLRMYLGRQRLSQDTFGRLFVNPASAESDYAELIPMLDGGDLDGIDTWIAEKLTSDGRRLLWGAEKSMRYKRENKNMFVPKALALEAMSITRSKKLDRAIEKLIEIAKKQNS